MTKKEHEAHRKLIDENYPLFILKNALIQMTSHLRAVKKSRSGNHPHFYFENAEVDIKKRIADLKKIIKTIS